MGVATASAVIEAPIDTVWDVMLDVDRYPEWNPFIERVVLKAGRPPQLGDKLVLHVRWMTGGRARATERITTLRPPSENDGRRAMLEYEYGGPVGALRLVRGKRRQELVQLEPGITAYTTHERLHGPLAGLAPLARVQDGFERHARALKARAESLVER
jgi:hypothetical protein